MKITTIASFIICVVLAISLFYTVFRYDELIREKDKIIEDQKVENWNYFQNWLHEAYYAHNYWQNYTVVVNPDGNLTDIELNEFIKDHGMLNQTIIDHADPEELEYVIFHVSKKPDNYDFGVVSDVNHIYEQVKEGFAPHNVLLNPEFEANLDFSALLNWLSTNFTGIPICLNVFEGGNESLPNPNVQLNVTQIQEAMQVADVRMICFAEMISWYMDYPNLEFPTNEVKAILELAKNNNIMVLWSEWKISDDVWNNVNNTFYDYTDNVVTYVYRTNNQYNEPIVGFLHAMQFEQWGASIQSWRYPSINAGNETEMPPEQMVYHTILARNMGAKIIQFEPYWYFFNNTGNPSDAMKGIWEII